ncbi:MAG: arylformamidase [Thermomicrobiales bacterium]|nr:arylformamidase [Thermomicrobiales bacterium]
MTTASRYIDITGTLAPEMWSYRPSIPDVPPFQHWRWATIDERGWEADAFSMATLAGTYLETSKHHFPDGPGIDEIPPERLFLDAAIVQIPKEAREHITIADLEAAAPMLQPGDALLIATGWDRYWWDDGTTFVMESPHFDLPAMEWIVARGVSILGGDMPCFDDPQPGQGQGVNLPLFKSGALILAPLVGLGQATSSRAKLIVLPIKLRGACGAPCRAIVVEE